jgi:hypothetical protein
MGIAYNEAQGHDHRTSRRRHRPNSAQLEYDYRGGAAWFVALPVFAGLLVLGCFLIEVALGPLL